MGVVDEQEGEELKRIEPGVEGGRGGEDGKERVGWFWGLYRCMWSRNISSRLEVELIET